MLYSAAYPIVIAAGLSCGQDETIDPTFGCEETSRGTATVKTLDEFISVDESSRTEVFYCGRYRENIIKDLEDCSTQRKGVPYRCEMTINGTRLGREDFSELCISNLNGEVTHVDNGVDYFCGDLEKVEY